MRTQVGIVGAGPAGLLLSHLLARRGIDSLVVEDRSRGYCEARQRAGLLEDGTVKLLREAGLGQRLDTEGLEHGGIYLQFAGERHHLDFRDLTGGRTVTIYAQTEIVKDLIARRLADGGALEFEVGDTEYGLSLGILTRDVMRGLDLARRIPTGIVHINDQTIDDAPNTPFGGVLASGTGARFGGTANLEAFTDTRWVTIRGEIAPYPF